MNKELNEQTTGGKFEIPDGFYVYRVDFDDKEPYVQIFDGVNIYDAIKIPVPKSLAYYLKTHHCGSMKMNDLIEKRAKNELRTKINCVLKIEI